MCFGPVAGQSTRGRWEDCSCRTTLITVVRQATTACTNDAVTRCASAVKNAPVGTSDTLDSVHSHTNRRATHTQSVLWPTPTAERSKTAAPSMDLMPFVTVAVASIRNIRNTYGLNRTRCGWDTSLIRASSLSSLLLSGHIT